MASTSESFESPQPMEVEEAPVEVAEPAGKGVKRKRPTKPKKTKKDKIEEATDDQVDELVEKIKTSYNREHESPEDHFDEIMDEVANPDQQNGRKKQYPLILGDDELPRQSSNVEKHYEGTMSEDPDTASRQCRICFRVFTTRDKLKRHAAAHQTAVEVYCTVCNAPIKYKYNLKNHLYKCLEDRRKDFEPSRLNLAYPGFIDQCEKAANDPTVPLPSLKNMPYKMNKFGLVTGFDPHLDIRMDMMCGKDNKAFNIAPLVKRVAYDQ